MTLHPIPPPVLLHDPLYDGVEVTKAWETDDHVFYLIICQHDDCVRFVWVRMKEKGIGGRTIDPKIQTWTDMAETALVEIEISPGMDPEAEIEAWVNSGDANIFYP
jgi:hypothetical protein